MMILTESLPTKIEADYESFQYNTNTHRDADGKNTRAMLFKLANITIFKAWSEHS
jgi:hypothetical protein